MTEPRDITIGGQVFAVPALPIRLNRIAYPLCKKLSEADLFQRCIDNNGVLDATDDELDSLIELAFLAVSAADKAMTRAMFDELPVTPPELLDVFFGVRYQTGAWLAAQAGAAPGEAPGA